MLSRYASEFLALALVHFLVVLTPGPDFAVTCRQSLRHGRRAGIFTALGIGAGISVHVGYTLLGISALMHATPWLMTASKVAGSAYLVYLGARFLRSQPAAQGDRAAPHARAEAQEPRRAFMLGFMTNATNPKATLFFLAVFTTLVGATTPVGVQALYGAWMCMVNAGWFVLVSLAFSRPAVRRKFEEKGHWIERGMGVALLVFSVRVLL